MFCGTGKERAVTFVPGVMAPGMNLSSSEGKKRGCSGLVFSTESPEL